MAFWNKWPYTNLQNLNLDWILHEIKKLKDESLTLVGLKERLDSLVGSNSETAKNADNLGGKPPAYYLPTVNLLDNTDFAIAQAGYPVWDSANQKWTSGLHGNKLYAADRWMVEGLAEANYSNQNGLTLKIVSTSVGRLIQRSRSDNIYGKPITAAVYLSDGSMIVATGTHPQSAPSAEEYFGQTTTTNMRLYLAALPAGLYDVHVWMRAGTMHTIKAIVCYEGTYTADTLPPFVPPDPLTELEKCQFFFRRLKGAPYATFGVGLVRLTHRADFFIPLGKMRIDNVSIYTHGSFTIIVNGGSFPAPSIAIDFLARSNTGIAVNVETDGHVLSSYVGQGVMLQADNDADAYIDICADI